MNNVVAFKDENGKRIEYSVLDQVLVNKSEYVLMSPLTDKENISVYKISFKSGQEELDIIENKSEIAMVKTASSYSKDVDPVF